MEVDPFDVLACFLLGVHAVVLLILGLPPPPSLSTLPSALHRPSLEIKREIFLDPSSSFPLFFLNISINLHSKMIHTVKAICLGIAAAAYCHDNLPPPGANALSNQTDKIKIEHWHSFSIRIRFPVLICAVYTVGTMVYLLEMVRGGSIGSFSVDQNLNVIKTWQLVALGVALVADALRKWSILTLNRFFTVSAIPCYWSSRHCLLEGYVFFLEQSLLNPDSSFFFYIVYGSKYRLTIRTQHKLVTTGPYRYLRHPSYTALLVNQVASYLILFHEGLWDIFAAYMSVATVRLIHSGIPLISSMAAWSPFAPDSIWQGGILGVPGGIWVTLAWVLFFGRFTYLRILAEEAMLEEHFGQEWREYAAKRWRYFPFVM